MEVEHDDAPGSVTLLSLSSVEEIAEGTTTTKQGATNKSAQLTATGVSGQSTPLVHGPAETGVTGEPGSVTTHDPDMEERNVKDVRWMNSCVGQEIVHQRIQQNLPELHTGKE